MHLELPSSHNDSRPEESFDDIDDDDDEAFVVTSKKKVLTTQETQTSLEQNEQYHPNPDKLKVRKTRHRRTSSHGSYNAGQSPRLSPMRERRISSNSSPRRSQGSYADLESYDTEKQPVPIRFFHHQKSTSSLNGNLTATSPEEMFPKRFSSSSSSSDNDPDECPIDHDVDDDILETLDRKVSEVINRSRLNSSNSINNTSDKYGPLSFSFNKKNSPSPNRRLSPMTGASGMVRFGSDDEDNADGHLTDDSSIDENESRLQWSDDEEGEPTNALNASGAASTASAAAAGAASSDGTVNNAVFMMRKR